jgi:hypothetical protein
MKLRLLGASLVAATALTAAASFPALTGWHVQAQGTDARAQGTDARVREKDALAQEKEKGKSRTPPARVAPDATAEPPEWSVSMPMPAIAPIELPDFNIEPSDVHISGSVIDMSGTWFFEDDDGLRTEREELRQTYQLSPGARVELSNINGSIDVRQPGATRPNCASRAIRARRTRANSMSRRRPRASTCAASRAGHATRTG